MDYKGFDSIFFPLYFMPVALNTSRYRFQDCLF